MSEHEAEFALSKDRHQRVENGPKCDDWGIGGQPLTTGLALAVATSCSTARVPASIAFTIGGQDTDRPVGRHLAVSEGAIVRSTIPPPRTYRSSRTPSMAVIRDLLEGYYGEPVPIVAFNITEGWSRDVTVEIADARSSSARYGTRCSARNPAAACGRLPAKRSDGHPCSPRVGRLGVVTA